jgi:metal-responsive CopG/Arc/MetJ family transcriptional regulator
MPLKIVTFKAEEELVEEIDKYASRLKMTRSEFIRMAIEKLILEFKSMSGEDVFRKGISEEVVAIIR